MCMMTAVSECQRFTRQELITFKAKYNEFNYIFKIIIIQLTFSLLSEYILY